MSDEKKIKIHILRCGSITVSRDAVSGSGFYLPALRAATPMRERMELPVNCYLLEHPRGLILIDSGLSRDLSPEGVYSARSARSVLPAPLAGFYHPAVPMGQAIHEQLSALGLSPSDLDYVFLTHLDADNVCGLRHLDGAKHILCSQEDYWWSCRTVYKLRQSQKLWLSDHMETFWFKGTNVGPFIWSKDFFDDGSFTLIHLPGHTDGQYGVLLRRGQRFAFFCSDAAYDRRSWEELVVPGFGFNRESQLKCLKWIQSLSRENGCVGIFSGHDPALTPGVVEL